MTQSDGDELLSQEPHTTSSHKRPYVIFLVEVLLAAAICGGAGGEYLFGRLKEMLDPNYSMYEWYGDFLSIARMLIWSVTGGLAVALVIHFRHHKYDPPHAP